MSTPINNKQPRTDAQIEASRINGAKSHGAVTEEGKRTICNNRMTHGFRSNCVVLCTEDAAEYESHLNHYLTRYAPIDKVEEDLVGLLASTAWQVMRNNSIELAMMELDLAGIVSNLDERVKRIDQYGLLALAFRKSAGDNGLELLRRYRSTAERGYHRAFQALEKIKEARQSAPPVSAESDPKPTSTVPTREEIPPSPPPDRVEKPQPQLVTPNQPTRQRKIDDLQPISQRPAA